MRPDGAPDDLGSAPDSSGGISKTRTSLSTAICTARANSDMKMVHRNDAPGMERDSLEEAAK